MDGCRRKLDRDKRMAIVKPRMARYGVPLHAGQRMETCIYPPTPCIFYGCFFGFGTPNLAISVNIRIFTRINADSGSEDKMKKHMENLHIEHRCMENAILLRITEQLSKNRFFPETDLDFTMRNYLSFENVLEIA